jgi:hypothetical protein
MATCPREDALARLILGDGQGRLQQGNLSLVNYNIEGLSELP